MNAGAKIFVINDDLVQLRLLTRVLEAAGYQVDAFTDGSEAVEALTSAPPVDLFVVDLHMPVIDGWKLCRLLRSPSLPSYNATPILIVSATFTGTDVEAITRELGADGFLPLPFKREDLLSDLKLLLAGERPATRRRALIVEDDDIIARVLVRSFEAHGYETHRAATVAEASLLWSTVGPDVVSLDYHLPDGSSIELLTGKQSPSDRTVVIVASGDADPALPVRMMEHGADAFVRKPYKPEFVVELAEKARRQRSLLRVETLLEERTQQLRKSELRYRSLFEAIPDLVIALDSSGVITSINGRASEALGCELDEATGRHVHELVPPGEVERITEALERVRAEGHVRLETVLRRPNLEGMPVEVNAASVDDAQDSAVLVVARDLTERLRAEEERRRLDRQVQHAQRLESLGVLAGGIAHDFNNLLVGVMGNASLALLDAEEGTSLHECITQIETAAKRAAELTGQILTFSGKGDSATAPHDLSEVVSEMGQLLAPAVSQKAKLTYNLTRDLPPVAIDPSQVRQVIMNLIMNASDALDGSAGEIEVSTFLRAVRTAEIRRHYLGERATGGRYVVLQVRDDGCGMDESTLSQIFDPFFTTKFAGRGLGLAATLGIIRSHNGTAVVDTAPGRGTTFQVYFPSVGTESTTEPLRAPSPASTEDAGTILVADEEPSVRRLVRVTLSRSGFSVVEAATADEAMLALSGHPRPDLAIVDLTLEAGAETDLAQAVRATYPDLPLVLSSGVPDASSPERAERDGAAAFLAKPYSPRKLTATIEALLDSRTDEDRTAASGEENRPSTAEPVTAGGA